MPDRRLAASDPTALELAFDQRFGARPPAQPCQALTSSGFPACRWWVRTKALAPRPLSTVRPSSPSSPFIADTLPSIVPAMPERRRDAILKLRRHLNRYVFKAVPEAPSRVSGRQFAVLLACLLILATLLQLYRIGPGTALNSLWAEDGPIFLQGALEHGFWSDLWRTYGGYLVFVPRLIGLFASLLPLRDAAAAVSILSTPSSSRSADTSSGSPAPPTSATLAARDAGGASRADAYRRAGVGRLRHICRRGSCSSPSSGCLSGGR